MKLILASASPRRKNILTQYGYTFDIISKDVDETFDKNLTVYENVLNVSMKKAKAVFNGKDTTIACDTIVVLDDVVYLKPRDEQDAFNTLKTLSNKTHKVISGVAILSNDEVYSFYEESYVTFKDLSDEDILNYIGTKECFGKAGAYAIQGFGKVLVKEYKGDMYNIIGLPIYKIVPILDKLLED